MKIENLASTLLVFASLAIAQTTTGLPASNSGDRLNERLQQERQGGIKKKGVEKDVVVFTGDRVIAQFVDGGSWKTSMYFVNLESHNVSFQVLFFNDDGSDLSVPVVGQGLVRGLTITLDSAGSIEFETSGTAPN